MPQCELYLPMGTSIWFVYLLRNKGSVKLTNKDIPFRSHQPWLCQGVVQLGARQHADENVYLLALLPGLLWSRIEGGSFECFETMIRYGN